MKKKLFVFITCLLFSLSGYSFTQIVTVKNYAFEPSSFTINVGDTIMFTWVNGMHTTTSLNIPSGATAWDNPINSTATSFVYVPLKTGTYKYKCSFHAALGMVANFTVACAAASAQISAGGSTVFCKGSSVLLSSNVSSSITTYHWQKNGSNIANANKSTYTVKSSGSYTLKVTNSCGNTATSNAINITVNPLPGATITPSDTVNICSGDSIKLQANTGTGLTYVWKRNGAIIHNATSSKYFAKTAGNYKVVVTKTTTGCSKTSAATTVEINCLNAAAVKLPDNIIHIFPNPSSNDFHIAVPSFNNDRYSLSVFDVDGKLIGEKKITSKDFSFGGELRQGIYFIEIKQADTVIMREKIIKE